MIPAISGSISVGLLLFALVGCQAGKPITGIFQGTRPMPSVDGGDATLMSAVAKVRLEVKPDGRATFYSTGITKEGFLSVTGSRAILEIDTVAGLSMQKQPQEVQEDRFIEFTWVRNGVWRTADGIELTQRAD